MPHPADQNAVGRYAEEYTYDEVGNLLRMRHRRTDAQRPGWARSYVYTDDSQLEPGEFLSNRLTSSTVGARTETYSTGGDGYDAHGNMLRMPHLRELRWDFREQLRMTRRQAVNAGDSEGRLHAGERTWNVYDSSGQRVRKVTVAASGAITDQRIYLGDSEIYRRAGGTPLVRETLHVMDGQDRVALVETRTAGSEPGKPRRLVRYQLANHLGSPCLELDQQADLISYSEWAPYGDPTLQTVRSQTETKARYGYTGKERDEETACITTSHGTTPRGWVDGPAVTEVGSQTAPICIATSSGGRRSRRTAAGGPTTWSSGRKPPSWSAR